MSALRTVVENLDGRRTESFAVDATEATLLALARELFEDHREDVIFGPCIEGAVFEGCFSQRPRLSPLDGYLTVEVEGSARHFRRYLGLHHGTPGLPTPPPRAQGRRLELWMRPRERHAGIPVEPAPTHAERPRAH